jgi:two-component system KDP operon response regulator KdpE
VLLDLGLPGIDGMTVLRALRARRGLAIIVITARDDELSRVDALEAGADDYVTKPFGMTDLVERVRTVVIRRAGGGRG